ncbi:hypothetical protein NLI96_g12709 [Meripilus lineatus]|uniref:Uncharacterized protein n=1 Tax=Meripilus lineatus TaxID=2056292 RepID=A0AAD5UPH3_9APHY|nr:hypothetical protein NLI96_g12709 [Physisporinus lineatus]
MTTSQPPPQFHSPSTASRGPYQPISVSPTIESLLVAFESPDFSSVSNLAFDVLHSMKMLPSFSVSNPSSSVLQLLDCIVGADPNSDMYSEDDHSISWGHAQYHSGSLSLSQALLSWGSLGNVDTALRFIAAGVQTVKMAKHICFIDNLPDTSLLASCYLQNTLELIWQHWKEAGGKLTKSQLMTWIQDKEIGCKNKNAKKEDLVNVILSASSDLIPTEEDINSFLDKPSKRKRS